MNQSGSVRTVNAGPPGPIPTYANQVPSAAPLSTTRTTTPFAWAGRRESHSLAELLTCIQIREQRGVGGCCSIRKQRGLRLVFSPFAAHVFLMGQCRGSASDFSTVRAPEFSASGVPLTCHQTANNRPKRTLRKTNVNKRASLTISLNMLGIIKLRLTRLG